MKTIFAATAFLALLGCAVPVLVVDTTPAAVPRKADGRYSVAVRVAHPSVTDVYLLRPDLRARMAPAVGVDGVVEQIVVVEGHTASFGYALEVHAGGTVTRTGVSTVRIVPSGP